MDEECDIIREICHDISKETELLRDIVRVRDTITDIRYDISKVNELRALEYGSKK